MFAFRLSFVGEMEPRSEDIPLHAEQLAQVGRLMVDILREHGYRVDHAAMHGPAVVDLLVEPAPAPADEDPDTKNERRPASASIQIPPLPDTEEIEISISKDAAGG